MRIFAKSSLSKEQLDVKVGIGCDGVEMQLLSELVDGKIGRYFKADEVFDLSSFNNYPIKIVHCPLLGSYMLMKYRNIEFAVENVTPLRKVYHGEICFCNNFHFDNVELVKYVRDELKTDRIGTCLDTCHAMVSNRYMTEIYKILEDIEYKEYTLDSYKETKDILESILRG